MEVGEVFASVVPLVASVDCELVVVIPESVVAEEVAEVADVSSVGCCVDKVVLSCLVVTVVADVVALVVGFVVDGCSVDDF